MARYFIGAGAIAIVWFILSYILSFMLAEAEDNPNMTATTPWLLKLACAIVFFPMRYLQGWDSPHAGVSDHDRMVPVIVGMLLNALLWGGLLILLWRLLKGKAGVSRIRKHGQ
jgi:hypothetical protein